MVQTSGLQKIVLMYEDYLHLPNDGKRYEILEGELFVSPAPKTKHQIVLRNLLVMLHQHVGKHKLGEVLAAPTDVILSRTNVMQPDLLFISSRSFRHRATYQGDETFRSTFFPKLTLKLAELWE